MTTSRTRTLRLTQTAGGPALVIRQQEGKGAVQVDAYFLSHTADAVIFSKHDGTRYKVTSATCDCPGHKHYGHKTVCRHRAAVAKLIALGKLKIVEVV
jgi:3-hydroxy-3-methylglutaryl CoA synthase